MKGVPASQEHNIQCDICVLTAVMYLIIASIALETPVTLWKLNVIALQQQLKCGITLYPGCVQQQHCCVAICVLATQSLLLHVSNTRKYSMAGVESCWPIDE